ncbi:GNAT family N-acetyltransferase [Candidatus Gracilibacteria bacterium]|nr:GNAT family N-acetyltransferase [Candidatus Gracilibacteria bacterium]
MENYDFKIFSGEDKNLGKKLRDFCLQIIQEVYGYSYRKDWHNDIDTLFKSEGGMYAQKERGCFFYIEKDGTIIACGGLRNIQTKLGYTERFTSRYSDINTIGSIWRFYIVKDERGKSLGKKLYQRVEEEAEKFGYTHLYLHCSDAHIKVKDFWEQQGFQIFEKDYEQDGIHTLHMDKNL